MAILFLLFLVSEPHALVMGVTANSSNPQLDEVMLVSTTPMTNDGPCHSDNVSSVADEGHNCTLGSGSEISVQASGSGSSSGSTRRRGDRYGNGQMSKADYELYMSIVDPVRFSLHVGVLPLLTLAVVSFSREKVISDSTAYMIAINILEIFCSFLNAVLYVMRYTLDTPTTNHVYIIWILLSNYGIVCGRRSVYVLTTVLCIQRFIAVTSPMKSRQMTSRFRRGTVLSVTIVVTFSFHTYLALMYDPKHLGGDVYIMVKSDWYADNLLLFDCFGYVSKTLFSFVPLLISLVINLILIVFMKRHNQQVKNMRSSKDEAAKSRQDRQMTWMILVSTLSFTILSMPSNINYTISTIDEVYGTRKQEHYLYSFVKGIVNALQTVADFVNFLCYVTLSSSFRQKVKVTLMCQIADKSRKMSNAKKSGSGQRTTNTTGNNTPYEVKTEPVA